MLQFDEPFCTHVRDCIATHRFKTKTSPKTMEAKILYDAEKLEALGAIGIERALIYDGQHEISLYNFDDKNRANIENQDTLHFKKI